MVKWFLESLRRRYKKAYWVASLLVLPVSVPAFADYAVQVGAYRSVKGAERFAATVRDSGFPVQLQTVSARTGGSLTLILVGPYPGHSEARTTLAQLKEQGIEGFVLRAPEPDQLAPVPVAKPANTVSSTPTREPAGLKKTKPAAGPGIAEDFGERDQSLLPEESAGQSQVVTPDQGDDDLEDLLAMPTSDQSAAVTGFFKSELAYTLPEPDHYSLFRHTLELRGGGRWGSRVQWRLGGRASYDAVFDITDYYSHAVEDDQRFETSIWESYLDVSAGDWDLRLGRQHVIWGEMVGLFFADVVSAKDLRQFVVQDFDMIRIPQWAVRIEHFMGDLHSEILWIPYPTYDEIGVPGAEFYPGPLTPPPGYVQLFQREHKPAGSLDQSGYGLRFSALKSGWDMAGFYYSSMDNRAAFYRQVTTAGGDPALIYKPDHKRIEQLGGTVTKDISPVVLRAEMVYTRGRMVEMASLSDSDGVVRQDHLDYAIGFDYAGFERSRLNFQFFQRWFPEHEAAMLSKRLESGVTLFLSTTSATGLIEPQLLVMAGLNRGDWLARPSLIWHAGDNWQISIGADVFGGSRLGLFGRYDDQDRLYTDLRYSF